MPIINFVIALGALLPMVVALLPKRELNDPASNYLSKMCYPLYTNATRNTQLNLTISNLFSSLANSPFPCEQEMYIGSVCTANGTTEIDFLAEQECLCNGAFFETIAGCDACFEVHGFPSSPQAQSSALAYFSAAECQPSPPFQPFSNLYPPINLTSISAEPPLTLGDDRFPNNTAISNYWTATRSLTPGEITGRATARLKTWTNTEGNRYTPTSIPPNSGITSTPSVSISTASSIAESSSASATGNFAAGKEIQAAGGLLAAALGVAILL